jgi:hypothetical protein
MSPKLVKKYGDANINFCPYPNNVQSNITTGNSIGCPTTYQTLHFFNNSNTNDDIAATFEQEYVRCVRNVTTS